MYGQLVFYGSGFEITFMIALHGSIGGRWRAEPFVARTTTAADRPAAMRQQEALLLREASAATPSGFRCYLAADGVPRDSLGQSPVIPLPSQMGYVDDGDIIRVEPVAGRMSVLYRKCSSSNAVFLTERCNCHCLMCPQPPKKADDSHWTQVWLEAIPLMSSDTAQLGITGGEPTVHPEGLLDVLVACREHLPRTAIHVLSNGRMCNYLSLCRRVSEVQHPNLVFGIPLYGDLPSVHDFIVQVGGAYDQTVRGIMNLRRWGLRVELRTVILRQNMDRLAAFARFVGRNLPFVEHVAFMGLELMGLARARESALWAEPATYQEGLKSAIEELDCRGIPVSIYNHPLCVLEEALRPFARQSISDWKTEYYAVCEECGERAACGGVFESAKVKLANLVCPP